MNVFFKSILYIALLGFASFRGSAQVTLVRGINSNNPNTISSTFVHNNLMYFLAYYGSYTFMVLRTDGTFDGTFPVAVPPLENPFTEEASFATLGGEVFFVVPTLSETQLWKTNGTYEGTSKIKSIPGGTSESGAVEHIGQLVSANGKLFFVAHDGIDGFEVWESDGTEAGTNILKQIGNAPTLAPRNLTVWGDKIVFFHGTVDGAVSGPQPWISDGTESGTMRLKVIDPAANDDHVSPIAATPIGLFFSVKTPNIGRELWFSDGTESGTNLLKDVATGSNSGVKMVKDKGGSNFAYTNGKFYFVGGDGVLEYLWSSDGTAENTKLATLLDPDMPWTDVDNMIAINDKIYYSGRVGTVKGLWVSDGTVAGSMKVVDMGEGTNSILENAHLCAYANKVWFSCYIRNPVEMGDVLCANNGMNGNAPLLFEVPGVNNPFGSNPRLMTVVGDKMLFFARSSLGAFNGYVEELYSYRDPSIATLEPGQLSQATVQPNPNTGNFRLSAPWLETTEAEAALIRPDGQVVRTWTKVTNEQFLRCDDLNPGLYFLKVTAKNGQQAMVRVILNR